MNLHEIKPPEDTIVIEFLRAYFTNGWEWTWHDDHPDYGHPPRMNHMYQHELRAYTRASRLWAEAGKPTRYLHDFMYR